MDASMIRMSYPAFKRGVEMARMPSGAVASILENEATKNTIFFDDFKSVPFVLSNPRRRYPKHCQPRVLRLDIQQPAIMGCTTYINAQSSVCLQIVKTVQNPPCQRLRPSGAVPYADRRNTSNASISGSPSKPQPTRDFTHISHPARA